MVARAISPDAVAAKGLVCLICHIRLISPELALETE
jgi:hypothetical protein